ncbi:MAG: hypothetical protein KGH49_01640 [Candidatus Micrarchaeota archaeon]|nr:hypothetical protein [Candidatus Micrarchaeota archaeon]
MLKDKNDKRTFCDVYVKVKSDNDIFKVFHEAARMDGLVIGMPVSKKFADIFLRFADKKVKRLHDRVEKVKEIEGVDYISTLPYKGTANRELRD